MVEVVTNQMNGLVDKWKAASFWKKFILINIAIPWTPIILTGLYTFAPPDLVELVEQNGKLVGVVAGTSWQLAGYFFAKMFGF